MQPCFNSPYKNTSVAILRFDVQSTTDDRFISKQSSSIEDNCKLFRSAQLKKYVTKNIMDASNELSHEMSISQVTSYHSPEVCDTLNASPENSETHKMTVAGTYFHIAT